MNKLHLAVLTTGDELLNGERCDTNTRDMAKLLGAAGYRIDTALTVPDNVDAIHRAILALQPQHDVIITTGGLGSTGDDITAKAVSQALERPLLENPTAVELIRTHYAQQNREFAPQVSQQAQLPEKAVPLPNKEGTAPGFWLRDKGCDLFFLPGVPTEMKAMLSNAVIPALKQCKPGEAPLIHREYGFFGLSEPQVESRVPYNKFANEVEVGFSLDYPLVRLSLRAAAPDADAILDEAESQLVERLGNYLVERDGQTMAEHVGLLLRHAGLKLTLAESCTGGLISQMLTSASGASEFLERSLVTYADSAKIECLGVDPAILATEGAVSAACAEAMAQGARQAARADLALSVTGIAGPSGGSTEKPVGTVFLALAADGICQAQGYNFTGDRQKIQRMTAFMALEWIRRFALESLEA